MKGRCWECDFYREDRCIYAESNFSHLTDIRCNLKIQTMLLRDIAITLQDFVYDDGKE